MSNDRFDAIVVGGGLAGLSAAQVMAEAELEVLLIEKGNYSGAKNVTGGRIYIHSLEKILPGFAERAPLERKITRERLTVMENGQPVTVEYDSACLSAPGGDSYSVLRGRFDKWLAEQTEESGVMQVCGVRADDLIVRGGKVCGVISGDEEMEADAVVLADGVNSLLGQKVGLRSELSPGQVAVGVKEVVELGEEAVNARFGLCSGEGLAWMFQGYSVGDGLCDGFLYTNGASVSVGVSVKVEDIGGMADCVPQLMEDFKNSAELAPLLTGGKTVEYSAHLIPEDGEMLPKLVGDGVLLAGDAAGLAANLGFTIRGMDLAVESGRLAAERISTVRRSATVRSENCSEKKNWEQQSMQR